MISCDSKWIRTGFARPALATAIAAAIAAGPGSPTALAEDASLALEEITVTARKREESVQDIPVSVTALSKELRQATLRRLEDIQGLAPNVIIRNINTVPGGSSISIRGVSYQEIDKSFDPAIGVVMDGMYLGVSSGQLLQNFDMQRIEVLRGPQGTLFGKNTIGGVVNVIRTEPTMEWGVDASVTLGDDGREDYKAVVNMPLVKDRLGLKLFGNDLNSDGWIHNTTLDQDVGGDDYQTYGFALLGRPTEDLSVKLHYEKNKDQTDVGAWSNFNQPDDLVCILGALQFLGWNQSQGCEALDTGSDEEHNSMNGHNPNDTEYDTGILTANWDLGSFLLTSITGYREQTEKTVSEYDSSSAPFLFLAFDQDYDQTSQELRLTSQFSDKVQFVGGLYYWKANYEQSWLTHELYYVLDRIGALVPGVPGGAGFTPDTVGYAAQEQETTSYAAFFSGDWHLDEHWTLSAGVRYTTEEKDFTGSNSVFYNLGGTPPALTLTDLNDDWEEVDPKFGVSYRVDEDILLFASWAQGFKSGGYFGRNTDFTTAKSYDPEYVDTYELGMKSGWLDNRIFFNTTLFYSEYDDKQEEVLIETAPGVVATNVVNAASAEMMGIDLELQAQLTERWSMRAGYGYLDADYDDFVASLNGGPETDNSYLTMRNAPQNTFGISTTYTIPVGPGEFSAYASYRYQDEIETILNNDALGHIDGIENLDLTLSYSWDKFRVTAFGRNMTDEVYARRVRIQPLVTFGQYTQGENYGVEFSVSY